MSDSLTLTIAAYGVALAGWAAWLGVRGRDAPRQLIGGVIVLEAGLLLQALVRAVALAGGDDPAEPGVAIGYLLAGTLVLPLAAGIPVAKPSSGEGAATPSVPALPVAIGCAAVAIVALRLRATWA